MPESEQGAAPRTTIVVVDDNDDVRMLTCTMLEGLGYVVVQRADATDALELLGRADVVVDLLLTDISMRGLGGLALAERARAVRPALPVLFMSGEPAIAGPGEFLAKPFTFAALDAAVHRALDAGHGAPADADRRT